ncbi:IQ domain-containing protein C isoform X2 [Triplophysa rosa]|uniref:IQ domain-containing protein C isoform X2 n=1 Tax=Triplophysa rosa TaxID=992332 RepID=UPI0025460279|nr:IQ domain-containing protein C isoform X2 [Triplophysa rosa]
MEFEWSLKLAQFQAFCRGYLKRRDLDSVRTQFEDIVREIDGGLDHLHWKGKIISKPHFTDTVSFHESLLLQYGRSKNQSHDRVDNSTTEQNIDNMDSEIPAPTPDVLVPEKDEAPETSDRDSCTPLDAESVVMPNLAEDSTTLWSSMNRNVSSSFLLKEQHLHFALKDTEHTSESLKQQRSTLAMELLWIQQAISSRKKYLTLRQRMDVSH